MNQLEYTMTNGNGDHRMNSQQSRLHVAIIMDGSGRWAETRGLPRAAGHRAGRAAVERTVLAALDRGIGTLTLFTFSTDNWGRPESEVAALMRTFEEFFSVEAPALAARGIRLTVRGRRDRLPLSLRHAIERVESPSTVAGTRDSVPSGTLHEIEQESSTRGALHVCFAIDYSGREAIVNAAQRFRETPDGSAESFARLFSEPEQGGEATPDIDLLIRTGGERRLSNCPLWEIAYAELVFTRCLWPDFGASDLDAALEDFYARERRFGRLPVLA
jgi:undecaprenyl diphosphate synthase